MKRVLSEQTGHFPDAEVVATEAEVQAAYERIAAALQPEVFAHECVVLGIMLGGLIPTARLSALLSGDYEMDYCQVSRYRGATRGGDLEWLQAPRTALKGKTVLLIDDIYDEGYYAGICGECLSGAGRHAGYQRGAGAEAACACGRLDRARSCGSRGR